MSTHDFLKQPVDASTDLLEHFIKHITLVQDWERIMVWEDGANKDVLPVLRYCYKRFDFKGWGRCDDIKNGKCDSCKPNLEKLNEWVKENNKNHLSIDEKDYMIKNAKRKILLENIFNKRLIPELYDDVDRYSNIRLIFEYPSWTVFPKEESISQKLGLHYERQQIELLRQKALQQKIKRETVKHGTKAAILSIDVRNMSHNIASHVLAYWIQVLIQLLQDSSHDNIKLQTAVNKSKALFRYIQHRADFLAEVATSIPCSEMSFDLKIDILAPFLKDSKPYNIADDNESGGLPLDNNVYVLLRYIAESEGIAINFGDQEDGNKQEKTVLKTITCEIDKSLKENDKEKPVYVSIPSGIIGKHAIYSILENFIRNAAKHYKGDEKDGETFIKINVENHNEDYIKVEITDIRRDSCKPKYVEDLNKFIEGGFVDEQGRLKSGGWGIKEMLVSANFLRKNTPEDLYDIITKRKTCNPRLLEIICSNNTDKTENPSNTSCDRCSYNKNLGIRFYLKRPKHLAVLVNGNLKSNIKKNVFEIKNITAAEFKDKPIPYNILLVDEKTYNDKYKDKDDPLVPCRVMVYDAQQGDNGINDNYYLCLYKKFIVDKIWKNRNPLPQIVNDLVPKPEYNFVEIKGISLEKYKIGSNQTNAENNIVFKKHPEEDKINTDFEKAEFFQPISGGFSTKAKFFNNKHLPKKIRNHFYLELIEAALTEVVIVDERISEWAGKSTKYKFDEQSGKTVREMLKKMKVYVPEIKKDSITYNGLIMKLKNALGCNVFSDNSDNAHFFVIHQGILDKLEENKRDSFINEKIKCRWKVIDSGRGVPDEMEHRFVQISALQTLLENYDKHGLVQTLFSLRKPVKEEQSGNQA